MYILDTNLVHCLRHTTFVMLTPLVLLIDSKDALRLDIDSGLPVAPDAINEPHLDRAGLYHHRKGGVKCGASYEFSCSYNLRTASRSHLIGLFVPCDVGTEAQTLVPLGFGS